MNWAVQPQKMDSYRLRISDLDGRVIVLCM